jgi:hypothetical protein
MNLAWRIDSGVSPLLLCAPRFIVSENLTAQLGRVGWRRTLPQKTRRSSNGTSLAQNRDDGGARGPNRLSAAVRGLGWGVGAMFNRIRDAALGLAALAFVAGFVPRAADAGTLSLSGNLFFEVLSAAFASDLDTQIAIEVVPNGANGFLIQGPMGSDLVPLGEDLLLTASVTAVNGTISDWTGELINTILGTMGEDVFDSGLGQLGGRTIIVDPANTGSFYDQVSFAPQTLIFLLKDINGMAGAIGGVIQGIVVDVPAPTGLALLASGLVGLIAVRRRRSA